MTRLLQATILSTAEAPAPAIAVRSAGWHSPVPYLFGGLAAMLGLIAFALLILACSYWKLSGYPSDEAGDAGQPEDGGEKGQKAGGWENNVLVIMAGQVVPTFLATPSTSRSSSFGDTSSDSSGGSPTAEGCESEKREKAAVELSESAAAGGAGGGAEAEDHQHRHSSGSGDEAV